jgi:hypothetical protein
VFVDGLCLEMDYVWRWIMFGDGLCLETDCV